LGDKKSDQIELKRSRLAYRRQLKRRVAGLDVRIVRWGKTKRKDCMRAAKSGWTQFKGTPGNERGKVTTVLQKICPGGEWDRGGRPGEEMQRAGSQYFETSVERCQAKRVNGKKRGWQGKKKAIPRKYDVVECLDNQGQVSVMMA